MIAAGTAFTALDPGFAAIHALVVGINDYEGPPNGPPKLFGAVNDAEDVSAALRLGGAASVMTLVDRDATRERVFSEWQSLVQKSEPGDLLVFHFAGHGINEPDENGDEADGQDETYLFADYDESNTTARIVDDELDAWLSLATDQGRKVLFVADACHSGSPTRSIFGETLPTRYYVPRTRPERQRPLVPVIAAATPQSRDSVFSVGATLDNYTLPEITIGDSFRGALSYAIARAFEGGADLDGDGTVLASEFEAFVQQNVRNLAASKQTPQFDMPDESFPIIGRVIAVVPSHAEEDDTLRIHVRPGGDSHFESAVTELQGVALTDDESAAALVFDPATGTLANNVRDVVAENLDPDGLKTAIEANRALTELQQLALEGTLPIAFTPGDEVHSEGTRIGFTVPDVGGKFVTVFDLTATGSVHFLWPLAGDSDPLPAGEPFSLDAVVTPPFGADNLVVLATDAPPAALRAELAKLDGAHAPAALLESLKSAVSGLSYRIALQAFFTRQN
jgi:hypothetical protein